MDGVMRMQTQADRDRIAVLADELAARTEHTSVILSLREVRALRDGFLRSKPGDEAIYNKLARAEARLVERLNA
jgi:hypothetical protein